MSILSKIKSLFIEETKTDEVLNKEDIVIKNNSLQKTTQEETKEQDQSNNQQESLLNEITYTLNEKQFEELCEKVYVKIEARIIELLNQNKKQPSEIEPVIFVNTIC